MRKPYQIYSEFVSKAHKVNALNFLKTMIELAEEGFEYLAEENAYDVIVEAGDVLFFVTSLANQCHIDLSLVFEKPAYREPEYYNVELSLNKIFTIVKKILRDDKPYEPTEMALALSRLISSIHMDLNVPIMSIAYLNMRKLSARFETREDLNALVQEASEVFEHYPQF